MNDSLQLLPVYTKVSRTKWPQKSGPLSQKPIKTPGLWVYLSLTWCNGGWYRSALHIILNSNNTDVVLHSWTEVLQGAGVLPCLHKLLHTVSLLPIGGSARHSVASDVLEGEILEEEKKGRFTWGGKWKAETGENVSMRNNKMLTKNG